MKAEYKSQNVAYVLVYWDPNAYDPERAVQHIHAMSESDQREIKDELTYVLKNNLVTAKLLDDLSNYGFRNDEKAEEFISAVLDYIFNDGVEPDIDDYT